MTVYVVQEVAGKNILSAEKYGDLELLLPEGSQLVLSTATTVIRIKSKLKERYFDCKLFVFIKDEKDKEIE